MSADTPFCILMQLERGRASLAPFPTQAFDTWLVPLTNKNEKWKIENDLVFNLAGSTFVAVSFGFAHPVIRSYASRMPCIFSTSVSLSAVAETNPSVFAMSSSAG